MLKYIFSLCLIMGWLQGYCQDTSRLDSLLEASRPDFTPRVLHLNYNMLRFGENLLNKPKNSQEIHLALGMYRYFVVADFGTANTDRGGDYSYTNSGTYWRVGIDANMSKAWRQDNILAFGLRYGRANFEDQADYSRTLASGEELTFRNENEQVTARWAELVFKLRSVIWKDLIAGYTMRYQFYALVDGAGDLQPFDIPGYGKTDRPNSFGFDFYLGWRINLSNQPEPAPVK